MMKQLSRHQFLRGTGACVSLPLLSAMQRSSCHAQETASQLPRTVMICGGLGFHAPFLFPDAPGNDYTATPYLELLKEHRRHLTVFSGLSHPEQNGNNGHASEMTWLTSAMRPGLPGFRNTISLDQLMASHIGGATRLPSLSLSNTGASLAWTSNGINIPAESSPSRLFRNLFVNGTEAEISSQLTELRRGRSILDTIRQDAHRLHGQLGRSDQQKLEEYFTAIRDLEHRIGQSESWTTRPRPAVNYSEPQDVADRTDIIAKQKLMYDLMVLALQTDSTRVITLALGGMNAVPSNIPGVRTDWHNLSHHGQDEDRISELRLIEEAEFTAFADFLAQLRQQTENDRTLLDNTAVLFGSNLGNASSHDWRNLPMILAGGNYRHGSYVAHDALNNTPLANLFVALAQRMGMDTDRFGSSTATSIRGLETT
jgi:hypothetical protein